MIAVTIPHLARSGGESTDMMSPMTVLRAGVLLLASMSLGATCDSLAPEDYERYSSASGLLIGEGDADAGRAAFVVLRCHSCHTVDRIAFPRIPSPLAELVPLGGVVESLPSDGYLATAVIHPSHDLAEGFPREVVSEDGRSRMADYSDVVTVRDLRNLVAFLHTRYRLPER
jgi:hypothetical protein